MEYVCNLMSTEVDAQEWARRREDQGWHVLSVADHFFTTNRPYPHLWVTCAALAAATERVRITTAFTNNLFRSPVEVAQAALSMDQLSGGRFELGLGAGWARNEIEAAGLAYPDRGARAGAFAEAAQILRSLLDTGGCTFAGRHYGIDIAGLGPIPATRIPLVAAVGGPRTIREVTPHCDRVELKAASPATRNGDLDFAALAAIGDTHLSELISRVRDIDHDIDLGMFVLCSVGGDDRTAAMAELLGDSLYGRFFGPAEKVRDGLEWLGELGISRCQLSPVDDQAFDRLAPVIFE